MAKRSSVQALPKAVKQWLDQALVENNFSGYDELVAELKARGCSVSRSSVHRYGQKFEDRVQAMQLASEQAQALVAAAPDDANAMSEALQRLVQEKLFSVLMALEVDPKDINITKVTRAIADLTRASISQKKWGAEAKARLDERLKVIEGEARKKSGDARKGALEMLKRVREEAYGIYESK